VTSATSLDQQCINTLRFLSVDMVQKANSGYPGLPLGAAHAETARPGNALHRNAPRF